MKILNKNNNSGYSIIISIIIIGLLLVLSTGILNMIISEMKDSRGMGDSIKAYAGAESAQELALLKIKENGYGYYNKIPNTINNNSILLGNNPLNISLFKKKTDVLISYDLASKTSDYIGILNKLGYNILPLFYVDNLGTHKINSFTLSVLNGEEGDLVWNIIGENSGISGTGTNIVGIMKKISPSNELKYSEVNIDDFLSSSNSNYLILFNGGNTNNIEYNIKSISGEFFSKPETKIISSGEIGEYKQNLETHLDNTKFLNRQKYSIYSN